MQSDDMQRQAAPGRDMADPLPTDPAYHPTLTMDDVARLYEDAGVPRNLRSLQRYAQQGKLAAQKIMTATGSQYLVTLHSVELHLTELRQMEAQARLVATGRDLARPTSAGFEPGSSATPPTSPSRQAATNPDMTLPVAPLREATLPQQIDDIQPKPAPTSHDMPRPVATPPAEDRYVTLLESENAFLRDQVNKKDTQIESLTRLSEGTLTNVTQQNTLLQGFQRLLGLGQKSESRGEGREA